MPGVIHPASSAGQPAKKGDVGWEEWSARTRRPTKRPNEAPTAMEGTKIPAGTLLPYEIMMRIVRIIVASSNETMFLQRSADLPHRQHPNN